MKRPPPHVLRDLDAVDDAEDRRLDGEVRAPQAPSRAVAKAHDDILADAKGDRVTVAIDILGARVGQEALVAFGSGARNVLSPGPDNRDLLCDAAIALLVDGNEEG